jgi:hypothetical protein
MNVWSMVQVIVQKRSSDSLDPLDRGVLTTQWTMFSAKISERDRGKARLVKSQ